MSVRIFVILKPWLSSELHFQINSRKFHQWIGSKSNKIIQFQFLLKGPFTILKPELDTALYDTSFHSQIHFISNQSQWIEDKSGKLIFEQEAELRFVMKCQMSLQRTGASKEWEEGEELSLCRVYKGWYLDCILWPQGFSLVFIQKTTPHSSVTLYSLHKLGEMIRSLFLLFLTAVIVMSDRSQELREGSNNQIGTLRGPRRIKPLSDGYSSQQRHEHSHKQKHSHSHSHQHR